MLGTLTSICQVPESGTFVLRLSTQYIMSLSFMLKPESDYKLNGKTYSCLLKYSLLKSFIMSVRDLQCKVVFYLSFQYYYGTLLWFKAVTVYQIGEQCHFLVFSSNGIFDDFTLHFSVDLGGLWRPIWQHLVSQGQLVRQTVMWAHTAFSEPCSKFVSLFGVYQAYMHSQTVCICRHINSTPRTRVEKKEW